MRQAFCPLRAKRGRCDYLILRTLAEGKQKAAGNRSVLETRSECRRLSGQTCIAFEEAAAGNRSDTRR